MRKITQHQIERTMVLLTEIIALSESVDQTVSISTLVRKHHFGANMTKALMASKFIEYEGKSKPLRIKCHYTVAEPTIARKVYTEYQVLGKRSVVERIEKKTNGEERYRIKFRSPIVFRSFYYIVKSK